MFCSLNCTTQVQEGPGANFLVEKHIRFQVLDCKLIQISKARSSLFLFEGQWSKRRLTGIQVAEWSRLYNPWQRIDIFSKNLNTLEKTTIYFEVLVNFEQLLPTTVSLKYNTWISQQDQSWINYSQIHVRCHCANSGRPDYHAYRVLKAHSFMPNSSKALQTKSGQIDTSEIAFSLSYTMKPGKINSAWLNWHQSELTLVFFTSGTR